MKKLLSLVLCVLMLVPGFIFQISADYDPNAELTNVAPYAGTYHSSVFNNDRSSKFINNGYLWNSYQMWEPCSTGRNIGPVDDTLQYAGLKFNDYYETESLTLYIKKWGDTDGGFCTKCMTQFKTSQLVEVKTEKGEIVSAACPNCTTAEKKQGVQLTYDDKNNIKYTVKALILGEWVVLGYGYNNDSVYYVEEKGTIPGGNTGILEIKFYEYKKNPETGEYLVDSNGDPIPVTDDRGNPVPFKANTKNLRIECTEFGRYSKYYLEQGYDPDKSPLWDHWWKLPIIHEAILMGREGYKPDFDVPEGAMLSSNASLGGFSAATSSTNSRYPALGNDNISTTSWKGNNIGGYDEYWIDFDTAYTIKTFALNFGGMSEAETGIDLKYNLSVKKNGEWVVVYSDQTATTMKDVITANNLNLLKTYDINDSGIEGVKVSFTSVKKDGEDVKPVINELISNITPGTKPEKCIFLADYMTVARKASTATGNLACYGQAYCSSSMDYSSISDVSYIIDGYTSDDSFSWFAETFDRGSYCGVVLKEAHEISKVVLYFNDAVTAGEPEKHVMQLEIQAKVNGQYVKVGEATSYDTEKKKPIVSVEINPTVTDDIRVVYITNGMVFPYLKELEVYSNEYIYSPYVGYVLDSSRTLHGRFFTSSFATRSAPKRAPYLDKMSPIEYFDIVMQYGIDVSRWI